MRFGGEERRRTVERCLVELQDEAQLAGPDVDRVVRSQDVVSRLELQRVVDLDRAIAHKPSGGVELGEVEVRVEERMSVPLLHQGVWIPAMRHHAQLLGMQPSRQFRPGLPCDVRPHGELVQEQPQHPVGIALLGPAGEAQTRDHLVAPGEPGNQSHMRGKQQRLDRDPDLHRGLSQLVDHSDR